MSSPIARRLWPALLLALLVGACDREPPKHWMTDTKVPFVDYGLFWMDNDRLLFQRMEYDAKRADKDNPWAAFTFPLTVWSDSGEKTLATSDLTKPCYAGGMISYRVEPDGEEGTFFFGKPGAMAETPLSAEEEGQVFNPFTCGFEKRPEGLDEHILVPLRPGDGIVNLGRRRTADPGRLMTPDGQAIPLPFSQGNVKPEGISVDGDSYLVFARTKRGAECRHVWRLVPGKGAVEEICLPEMKSSRVVKTALGWALDKREYDRDGGIGDSGIFLVPPGGDPIKLAAGFTENLAVSPNGCRLAFGQAKDLNTSCMDGTYKQKTVKVIDLCGLKGEILAGE